MEDHRTHANAPGFIEPMEIEPVLANGVAHVHIQDGMAHVAFFREQLDSDGAAVKIIVARVVLPEVAIAHARQVVDMAFAEDRARRGREEPWTH